VLATSAGTLSAVTDNGDGTYTAILTSPTQVTVASISGKVEGNNITDTATVNFVPGPASGATSTITSAQTTLIANGVSTSVVTIQLKDINGNNLTSGGDNVTLTTTLGTLSDVADNGDGTYSAMLTSSSTAGIAEITGVVNTNAINDNATITLTPATSPVLTATISANATTAIADGESTVQIVVTVRNASGTLVPGATILFNTTAGTLSSVVDNNDGTYTVTLTSSIIVEVAEVSFTINGVPNEETLDISFVDAPSIPTLFIPQGFSPDGDGENDTFVIEGAESFTVTLRIYNRWGAMVYESRHYKNDWAGLASHGVVIGDKLPDGTYFYAIDLNNGQTPFVRSMTIKRK
jgi:gliding motility-associated-like protein